MPKRKNYIPIKRRLPPEGEIVLTKIDDQDGRHNVRKLIRKGYIWLYPNSNQTVLYAPTHWKAI